MCCLAESSPSGGGDHYSVRDECLGWDGEAACRAAAIDLLPPDRLTHKREADNLRCRLGSQDVRLLLINLAFVLATIHSGRFYFPVVFLTFILCLVDVFR